MKILSLLVTAALTLGLAYMYLQRDGGTSATSPSAAKAQLDDVRARTDAAQKQAEERIKAAQQRVERNE